MRVDPLFSQNALVSLNQLQASEQQLTQQLSSGVRVNSLADDPSAAGQDVLLQYQLGQDTTFTQAAASTTGRMQIVDSVLGGVVTQLTQALSAAIQGNNGTLNPADRSAVAAQLTGIRDEVLSLANTTYQGNSLFAGSRTSSQAFSLNTSTTPATITYNGDGDVLTQTTPAGGSIDTSIPGDRIFGSGGANVLGVLNQVIADFSSPSLSPGASADTEALNATLNRVDALRAAFGTSLSRLQSTITYTQTQEIQLQSEEDTLIAADPAKTATDLKNAEVEQSAILSVMSSVNQTNLFDYLK